MFRLQFSFRPFVTVWENAEMLIENGFSQKFEAKRWVLVTDDREN